MTAAHSLEEAEVISEAGHEGKLGTYIGVTMAILGVLLAYCSALVGSERTLLLRMLMEQQSAHAKYQAQNVKHRVALMALAQVSATALGAPNPSLNKATLLDMAQSVDHYLEEATLADDWTNSFDGIIKAHMEAQETYEQGLLSAEIGIVIASIALLFRRKEIWQISILLGILALFLAVKTMIHAGDEVKEQTLRIKAAEKKYEDARTSSKTAKFEEELVRQMITWAGGKPAKAN